MVEATRVVPGAPPPAPLSKSQRKKRKAATGNSKAKSAESVDGSVTIPDSTAAALVEKAPEETDIKEGSIAPELVASTEEVQALDDESSLKPSPIIELLQKRCKALNKKIGRVSSYASTEYTRLNDDQKRTLKTLPSLEAVQKELEEVKKAIEVHEADLQNDIVAQRAEAERAEKARIVAAVSATENSYTLKTSGLLTLLRLHSILASGHPPPASLNLDESEGSAIFSTTEALLGEEGELKQSVVSGILSGVGDFNGVSYARLLEIVHSYLNPPREPTPVPEEPAEELGEAEATAETPVEAEEVRVAGIPGALSVSSSFHFMQASELEAPSFEESAEWVERPEVDQPPTEIVSTETSTITAVNGHIVEATTEGDVHPASNGAIDWAADDEGGLPSIAGLQASFAPSGSATPILQSSEVTLPVVPDVVAVPRPEDDGFTPTRTGRGRPYRGGDRGGFRGGFRGGDRGGDRGGYRNDRGFRGSGRGGDRGDRGGYRGRPNGDWRGGDSEGRGRGRGRPRGDRGGFHERRGAPPS
ncbi:hypothetical protein SERLA73DRAFT_168035 [Serpula lacrymans var. lacrymans S7.3]|uniref:Uncharacterized protein n=1 Tax=Serpula lacrymans var. lacrymans (strain S7.3) TaxID=936435 RepID=F8PW63_SERL3|nr:hypothetical protein SERLA73DRAFT_168035 [Serpula lacrymans var. lacrymans S7.3]